MVLREIVSDLPKLGAREYIQGGTIFNGVLALCDEALGPSWIDRARIPSFKLEREGTGNGRLILSDAPITEFRPNATFLARSPLGDVHAIFVDEGLPFRREDYNEEQYNQPIRIGTDLSGEFILPAGKPRVDFIKGVVGANKLLHQKTDLFGGELKKIQFLYLKDLTGECIAGSEREYRLSITNLTVKQTETEIWTINRIAVDAKEYRSEFRLCYRAQR